MKHKHKWEILSENYPLGEDEKPHRVLYCSCGEKKVENLSQEEARLVAIRMGIITEEVVNHVSGSKHS